MRAIASRPTGRMPILLAAICLAAMSCVPLLLKITAQTDRHRELVQSRAEIRKWPEKAKRWALVIGVDQYQDSQISKLEGAANDAKSLADALVRSAGFPEDQVTVLASDQPFERRPIRGNILQRLSNLRGLVPEDGLLLVSFAGHGIERGGRGFLCPEDARINGDMALLEATAIPVETVREWIRLTGVKQVVIILDACRNDPSGRGEGENRLTESYARQFNFDVRNREVNAFATFYATNVGHVAYEYKEKKQGYFTWALVDGIKGAAANDRGEVTLAGLKKYLEDTVPKRVAMDLGQEKKQRPSAAIEGYKADELVISVTERVLSLVGGTTAGVDPKAIELSFWQSIQNSTDTNDFKEYLRKYPDGQFAGLARNRLERLTAAARSDGGVPNPGPGTSVVSAPSSVNGSNSATTAGLTTGPGGIPLRAYEFDTVKVDSRGSVVDRRKGQARYFVEDLGGRVTLEMVAVPAGQFLMGTADAEVDHITREYQRYCGDGDEDCRKWAATRAMSEIPQHSVTLKSFYIGKFEVTQAQWRAVAVLPKVDRELNANPSAFRGDELPVEQVSWSDAVEFCARLSRKFGITFRLPSEDEWEYACRGGTVTPFASGENLSPDLANYNGGRPYSGSPQGPSLLGTVAVGSLRSANGFGLYEMHGNVWEWCMDTWHANYHGAPADGSAWVTGGDEATRVLRGGCFINDVAALRSASRGTGPLNARSRCFGFRVVVAATN